MEYKASCVKTTLENSGVMWTCLLQFKVILDIEVQEESSDENHQ